MATLRDYVPGYSGGGIDDLVPTQSGLPEATPLIATAPLTQEFERNGMTQTGLGYKSSRLSDQANWMEVEAATRETAGDVQGAQTLRGQINGLRQQAAYYAPAEQDITKVGLNPGRILDYGLGAVGSMGASMQDSLLAGGAVRGAGALLKQSNNPLVKGAGLAAAFVPNLLSNSGEQLGQYQEDKNIMATTTAGERLARGLGTGAVMGALDTLPEAGILSRVAGKGVGAGILRNTAMDVGKEAATEVAQTGVQKLDLNLLNPNRDGSEDWRDYANAAAQAGLGSTPMHGASNVLGAMGNRIAEPGDPGTQRGDDIDLKTGKKLDGSLASLDEQLQHVGGEKYKADYEAKKARSGILDGSAFNDATTSDEMNAAAENRRAALVEELTKAGDRKSMDFAAKLGGMSAEDIMLDPLVDDAAKHIMPKAGLDADSLKRIADGFKNKRPKNNERNFLPGEANPESVGGLVDTSKMASVDPKKFAEQKAAFDEMTTRGKTAARLIEDSVTGGGDDARLPASQRGMLRDIGQELAAMSSVKGKPAPGELFRAERLGRIVGSMLGEEKVTTALEQAGKASGAWGTPLFSAFLGNAVRASGKLTKQTVEEERMSRNDAATQLMALVPADKEHALAKRGINLRNESLQHWLLDGMQDMFDGDETRVSEKKAVEMFGAEAVEGMRELLGKRIEMRMPGEKLGTEGQKSEKLSSDDVTKDGEESDQYTKDGLEKSSAKAAERLGSEVAVFGRAMKHGVSLSKAFEDDAPKLPALLTIKGDDDEKGHSVRQAVERDAAAVGGDAHHVETVPMADLFHREGIRGHKRVKLMRRYLDAAIEKAEGASKEKLTALAAALDGLGAAERSDKEMADLFQNRTNLTINQRAGLKQIAYGPGSPVAKVIGDNHPAFTADGERHTAVHKAVKDTIAQRLSEVEGLAAGLLGADTNGEWATSLNQIADRYFADKHITLSTPKNASATPDHMRIPLVKLTEMMRRGASVAGMIRNKQVRDAVDEGLLFFYRSKSDAQADEAAGVFNSPTAPKSRMVAVKGSDLVAWVREGEFLHTKNKNVRATTNNAGNRAYLAALSQGIGALVADHAYSLPVNILGDRADHKLETTTMKASAKARKKNLENFVGPRPLHSGSSTEARDAELAKDYHHEVPELSAPGTTYSTRDEAKAVDDAEAGLIEDDEGGGPPMNEKEMDEYEHSIYANAPFIAARKVTPISIQRGTVERAGRKHGEALWGGYLVNREAGLARIAAVAKDMRNNPLLAGALAFVTTPEHLRAMAPTLLAKNPNLNERATDAAQDYVYLRTLRVEVARTIASNIGFERNQIPEKHLGALQEALGGNVNDIVARAEKVRTPAAPAPKPTGLAALPDHKPGQKTMRYAGVGSRRTPPEMAARMTKVAKWLAGQGYTLFSGGADGADKAFEAGATAKEIFRANDATPAMVAVAKEVHPRPEALGGYALKLMARNTAQVFGRDLNNPVDFVLAWTPDGAESTADRNINTGGTGQAIDLASRKGVPVINLAREGWEARLKAAVMGQAQPVAEKPASKPITRAALAAEKAKTLNVWHGSGENAQFSNLAGRPFTFEGRPYRSVEHAYQSLKSGEFDPVTYGKYNRDGVKIVGTKGTKSTGNWNVDLMNRLVMESFKQNPDAAKALAATGDAKFTHTQDVGVWKDAFPAALEAARAGLVAAKKTLRPAGKRDGEEVGAEFMVGNLRIQEGESSIWVDGKKDDIFRMEDAMITLHTIYDEIGKGSWVGGRAVMAKQFVDGMNDGELEGTSDLLWATILGDPEGDFTLSEANATLKDAGLPPVDSLDADAIRAVADATAGDTQTTDMFGGRGTKLNERTFPGAVPAQDADTAKNGQERKNTETQATPSEADIDAVRAQIGRLLGPKIKVLFKEIMQGNGSWDDVTKIVTIALAPLAQMKSVAHHEAMHAFFSEGLKDYPEVKEMLQKAMAEPRIAERLQYLLRNSPKALKAIERDPEEAVAYAFEFWTEKLLDMGTAPATFFEKVQRFIRGVFGMIADSERALEIFQGLYDGKMADPSAAETAIQAAMERGEGLRAKALAMDKQARWVKTRIMAANRVVAETGPVGKALADMWYVNPGSTQQGTEPGVMNRRQLETNKRMNRLMTEVFNGLSDQDMKDLNEAAALKKKPEDVDNQRVAKSLANLYKLNADMYRYVTGAGVQIGTRDEGTYTPMVWNQQYMIEHKDKFVAMLMEHYPQMLEAARATAGQVAAKNLEPQDVAEHMWQAIIDRTGVDAKLDAQREDGVLSPFFASENGRSFDWIAPEHRKEFLSTDLVHTMTAYIHQAVRSAEYVRTFGVGGSTLSGMLERVGDVQGVNKDGTPKRATMDGPLIKEIRAKASADKVPEDQLEAYVLRRHDAVRDSVGAMEGVLGKDISDRARKVNSYLMTYQHLRLLPLSLFAAMLDPIGILVSGGKLDDAIGAYVRGMKGVIKTWKSMATGIPLTMDGDEAEMNALLVGTLDSNMFLEGMGDAHTSEYMDSGVRKVNHAFFKLNGLTAWDRNMRIAATGAAINFITAHDKNANPQHSARWMDGLGLKQGEVIYGADGKMVLDSRVLAQQRAESKAGGAEKFAALAEDKRQALVDGETRVAEQYMNKLHFGIQRFVQRGVLSPNAAVRPAWASDPHYAALFHLKQYTYGFHEIIMRHVKEEAMAGNYGPGLMALTGVPVMIASDITKGLLTGGGSLPGYMANWGLADWLTHGWARAGLNGIGQIGLDAVHSPASLLGPTADQIWQTAWDPLGKLEKLDMVPGARIVKGAADKLVGAMTD